MVCFDNLYCFMNSHSSQYSITIVISMDGDLALMQFKNESNSRQMITLEKNGRIHGDERCAEQGSLGRKGVM